MRYFSCIICSMVLSLLLSLSSQAKLSLELNCHKKNNSPTTSEMKLESKNKRDASFTLVAMELIEFAYCGDGKVQLTRGEECDDGNKEAGDGCALSCKKEIQCHFDNECQSGYCGFNGFCDPIDITINY